jgi:hypothetical protein
MVVCLQVEKAFGKLDLVGHLVGILSDTSVQASGARSAALEAITALCRTWPQGLIDFFFFNGVNTILQMLLQPERHNSEALMVAQLLEQVVGPTEECRSLMSEVGGIDVLVQTHRDASADGLEVLRDSTMNALAVLTYRCAPGPLARACVF